MSVTRFTSSDNDAVKNWTATIFSDIRYDRKLAPMTSMAANMPIFEFEDLSKGRGDTSTFRLIPTHENDSGVQGTQILEGNEETLTSVTDTITLEKYRHAIRFEADLNDIRLKWDLPGQARTQLSEWGAKKVERLIMDKAQTSLSHNVLPKSTYTSGVNDILATDLLDPEQISRAKYYALNGGGQVRPPIRPFKIDGEEHLLLVVHPYQAFDLVRNPEFTQARREAEIRGKQNPLFTGLVGVWDGVMIMTHNMVGSAANTGSVTYAKSFLLGAQGLAWVWGKRPKMVVDMFDYEDQVGIAFGFIAGAEKPQFTLNSTAYDYGIIGVPSAFTSLAAY